LFDSLHITRFSPYLEDISLLLPEDFFDLYRTGDASKLCIHNNKWIGLPFYLKYRFLYSNIYYMQKYNMTEPSTWDELIEKAEYILNEEKKIGNTDIFGYNGFFPGNDNSVGSLLEFIYSFRDSKDSPCPDLNSQNAIDALNKIIEIKNRISSK